MVESPFSSTMIQFMDVHGYSPVISQSYGASVAHGSSMVYLLKKVTFQFANCDG
jgi:acetyl-CoA carboxylase carboxyltransferase component